MTTDKNFKRIVRQRMAKTGESYSTALSQIRAGFSERAEAVGLRPLKRFSTSRETVIEALERASQRGLKIVAYPKHSELQSGITFNEALTLIRSGIRVAFAVIVDGREVPL